MKKLLYIILLSAFGTSLLAQTPLEEAIQFSAKDVHGETHDLFEILDDQNKFVLIDFFSVTCGPCQTMAPKIDSVYAYFGNNQLDLYVLAIDQFFNNEMVLGFEEEYNTHYPAISGVEGGGSQIYEDYQIPYYPSLILIAPDHTIVEQAISIPNTAQELIDLLENTYGLQSVSVNEIEKETAFIIYPNPASQYFILQAPSNQKVDMLTVYSITGNEVIKRNSFDESQPIHINIENLINGMYLVSVKYSDGSRFSNRFMKK